jgi:tetratricopeptide (TPR) repeat protein
MMKSLLRSTVAGWALILLGVAQSDLRAAGNGKTPESLIETIKQELDAASRLKLLEVFLKTLPPNESTTWAYEEMFRTQVETGQLDRALETGETLLARDQREIEIAYKSLAIAKQKGDPALVQKWSDIAASSASWWASFPLGQTVANAQAAGDGKVVAILIEMVKHAPDPERRLKLLDVFVKTLPPNESTNWAYEEIFRTQSETGQLDRALETGETLLTRDQRELQIAYKSLEIAGQKGDQALVKKWSEIAAKSAACILSSPGNGEAGDSQLTYAIQVRTQLDYVAYKEILETKAAGKRLELSDDFLRRNTGPEYRHAVEGIYLAASRESGNRGKILAAAERVLKVDANSEDALLILGGSYLESQTEPETMIGYANRILTAAKQNGKPVELTDAEWAKKKSLLEGAAYWMIGNAAIQQKRYADADKFIRLALPYVKDDRTMSAATLFYLGWANYQLKNYRDAVSFNEQCAQIQGPYQENAVRNLQVIRAESGEKGTAPPHLSSP